MYKIANKCDMIIIREITECSKNCVISQMSCHLATTLLFSKRLLYLLLTLGRVAVNLNESILLHYTLLPPDAKTPILCPHTDSQYTHPVEMTKKLYAQTSNASNDNLKFNIRFVHFRINFVQ